MPSERVFSLALTCEPAIVQPFPAVFGGNSGQSGKRAALARPAGRPPAAALRHSGTWRRGPDSAPGVENPDGKRQKRTPAPATEASPGRRLRGVAGGSPVLVWKALCIAALGGVLFRKSRIGVGALPPATASRTACEESRTRVEGAVRRERYSRRTREVPYPRTMYRRAPTFAEESRTRDGGRRRIMPLPRVPGGGIPYPGERPRAARKPGRRSPRDPVSAWKAPLPERVSASSACGGIARMASDPAPRTVRSRAGWRRRNRVQARRAPRDAEQKKP